MMKKFNTLLMVVLMSVVPQVIAGECPDGSQNPNCQYPGAAPNWDQRFTVGCSMTNNDNGEINYNFDHGALDYKQAGHLMIVLQTSLLEVYLSYGEEASMQGVDPRLIRDLVEIERVMSGRFDE